MTDVHDPPPAETAPVPPPARPASGLHIGALVLQALAGVACAGLFSAFCLCVAGRGVRMLGLSDPFVLAAGLGAGSFGAFGLARARGRDWRDAFGMGCISVAILQLLAAAAFVVEALVQMLGS